MQKAGGMRESSSIDLAGDRMNRTSDRPLRPGGSGRSGFDSSPGDPPDRASSTPEAILLSHRSEAEDRDDGLGAARGGIIGVLFGLLSWLSILLSMRLLS